MQGTEDDYRTSYLKQGTEQLSYSYMSQPHQEELLVSFTSMVNEPRKDQSEPY